MGGPVEGFAPAALMIGAGLIALGAGAAGTACVRSDRKTALTRLPPRAANNHGMERGVRAHDVSREVDLSAPCEHASQVIIREVHRPARGCEECLKTGGRWVHLRECLTCGRVGCCDSSPNKHASAHYRATAHPIVTSLEPGETWCWCYVDEELLS